MLLRVASREISAMIGSAEKVRPVMSRDQNVKMSTRRTGSPAPTPDCQPRTVDP